MHRSSMLLLLTVPHHVRHADGNFVMYMKRPHPSGYSNSKLAMTMHAYELQHSFDAKGTPADRVVTAC